MKDLKNLYEKLGFQHVQTYVQSGNVVFGSNLNNLDQLEQKIEIGITTEFGLSVKVLVKKASFLKVLEKNNPFLKRNEVEKGTLYVSFLSQKPDPTLIPLLQSMVTNGEEWHWEETEIYLYCPKGYGKTKISNPFLEKKLNVWSTTRNWKTIEALRSIFENSLYGE